MSDLPADIVIVGAGMMGAAVAVALAETGLAIHVVDRDSACFQSFPTQVMAQQQQGVGHQVSAITPASQAFLMKLGVWDLLERDYRVSDYQKMHVWDGEGTGKVSFNAHDVHQSHLGHIVENRAIRAALFDVASRFKNIELHAGADVVDLTETEQGSHRLQLSHGAAIVSPLVVVADGANSQTRKRLSIPMWEWDYKHHALVATVATEQSHQNTAWQRFTGTGPLAVLPLSKATAQVLGHESLSSIVWSSSPDHIKRLSALDAGEFERELTQAFEGHLGAFSLVSQPQVFPLRQRHAKYYVRQGVALLGDAAHTIHPLAGQGANLGFMDAQALTNVLVEAHERGEALADERVLRRYQRLRQRENLKMAAVMEGFERLFDSKLPFMRLARNFGLSAFDKTGLIKNHIMFDAMGLN